MNKECVGSQIFLTFPSPVHFDESLKTSPPISFEMAGCNITVWPFYRSRPIGWLPYPLLTSKAIAHIDPALSASWPRLPGSAALAVAVDDTGAGVAFVDLEENFNTRGQFSGDTLSIRAIGLETEDQREKLSANIFEYLMRHIRVETKQWWAGRREIANVPTTRTSFEMSTPCIYNGNAHSGSPGYFVHDTNLRPLSYNIFAQGLEGFKISRPVDAKLSALSDVIFYHAQGDLTLTFVLACSTVETASNDIYKILKKNTNGFNILRQFTDLLETTMNRNLKTERSDLYQFLENIWAARNNVAHGASFFWKSDKALSAPPQHFTQNFEELLAWFQDVENDAQAKST